MFQFRECCELSLAKLRDMVKAAHEAQRQEKAKRDRKSYGLVSDFNRSGISTAELRSQSYYPHNFCTFLVMIKKGVFKDIWYGLPPLS